MSAVGFCVIYFDFSGEFVVFRAVLRFESY
jgi:hypothetical protein